jgi:hypothetical protein
MDSSSGLEQTHIKNCPQGNCLGRAQHAVGDGRQHGIRMSRATDPVTFHSGADRGSCSAFMGMNTNNPMLSSTSTRQLERMIDDAAWIT